MGGACLSPDRGDNCQGDSDYDRCDSRRISRGDKRADGPEAEEYFHRVSGWRCRCRSIGVRRARHPVVIVAVDLDAHTDPPGQCLPQWMWCRRGFGSRRTSLGYGLPARSISRMSRPSGQHWQHWHKLSEEDTSFLRGRRVCDRHSSTAARPETPSTRCVLQARCLCLGTHSPPKEAAMSLDGLCVTSRDYADGRIMPRFDLSGASDWSQSVTAVPSRDPPRHVRILRAPGGTRTHTGTILSGRPLPIGLRGRMDSCRISVEPASEPRTRRQPRVSPATARCHPGCRARTRSPCRSGT